MGLEAPEFHTKYKGKGFKEYSSKSRERLGLAGREEDGTRSEHFEYYQWLPDTTYLKTK